MWVLKIVTDGQTDSLGKLIKCVVIRHSYSYAFWSMSLRAPDQTEKQLIINFSDDNNNYNTKCVIWSEASLLIRK